MIGIVFIGDYLYCPYLKLYEKIIKKCGLEYEFLFWNRTEINTLDLPSNYIAYSKESSLKKKKIEKAIDFYGYRKWVKERIRHCQYDKLIVLSTLSGIIIFDILLKEYPNNYIYDIRDYSYENIVPFLKLEKKLLLNSAINSISSKGFLHFLPQSVQYVPVHNLAGFDIYNESVFRKKKKGQVLNIVWNGAVRYFNHQKTLIENLGNDPRFNLFYYGSGADYEEYKFFLEKQKYENVFLMGPYDNSEKNKILKDADIINNSYEYSMETQYAMPNKYYDAIVLKIPQLVEPKTYKCKEVEEQGLGIGLDVNDLKFGDKLYNFYHSIHEEDFNSNCKKELEKVLYENETFEKKVIDFCLR